MGGANIDEGGGNCRQRCAAVLSACVCAPHGVGTCGRAVIRVEPSTCGEPPEKHTSSRAYKNCSGHCADRGDDCENRLLRELACLLSFLLSFFPMATRLATPPPDCFAPQLTSTR